MNTKAQEEWDRAAHWQKCHSAFGVLTMMAEEAMKARDLGKLQAAIDAMAKHDAAFAEPEPNWVFKVRGEPTL